MQTLSEIRELLAEAGQEPTKRFGQNFLIDANLMAKLIELADMDSAQTVLEIGPGTGSLTEELVARAGRVVAVEIDRGLAALLQRRLGGQGNLTVLQADALAGKHKLAPEVLAALAQTGRANLVSNLPYNVAVPILINCLNESWRSLRTPGQAVRFSRLTFTVQRELADRLVADMGSSDYGPVSVLVSLLARSTPGRILPPQAFWPPPKVHSQMVRLDFDETLAEQVKDLPTLSALLGATFQHRRKKISTAGKRRDCPFDEQRFLAGLGTCEIDPDSRPEQVSPEQFRRLANWLEGFTRIGSDLVE